MVDRSVRSAVVACATACLVFSALHGSRLSAQTVAARVQPSLPPATTMSVSLDVVEAPLSEVLEMIAQRAGLISGFGAGVSKSSVKVTLHLKDVAVSDAFTEALRGTGYVAVLSGRSVAIKQGQAATTSIVQGSISGKVFHATTKAPLRGATVSLDGANKGLVVGDDGSFRFSTITPGTHTVNVRLLGYVKAMKTVTVVEGQTVSIEVALEPSVSALDQVVVTGTVAATARKAIPNAMTVITAKDIEDRGITRIDQLFRGDVPGLFVQNRGASSPLDSTVMYSRGATSISAAAMYTSSIKTYVDGVELADPTYLGQIDPRNIERIEILTGPQATTIYGSNAISGVMQVFTKRGTTVRPQLSATLLSGVVQNNSSQAMTPQHDYSALVSGTDGHWSYDVGGTWTYVGRWTPAQQTAGTRGFGGVRFQRGPVSADLSMRNAVSTNQTRGSSSMYFVARGNDGFYMPRGFGGWGYAAPVRARLSTRTVGLTLDYAPTSWWSHELVAGTDEANTETETSSTGYSTPTDTLLTLNQTRTPRTSLTYTTTARIGLGSATQAILTGGADEWQRLYTYLYATPTALTGTLTGTLINQRLTNHNTGAFVQAQIGFWDALFITYGLRGEWNPTYGADQTPNLSPRYGVAYTHDMNTPFGPVTAKLRGSYGRATRPPQAGQAAEALGPSTNFVTYGRYNAILANPDLGPEYEQGGEGGLELYWGNRSSLVVTRYNQTVDHLIDRPKVDSVLSLAPNATSGLYTYAPIYQYLNVGTIRNAGWELQGSLNTGPITTRGTYSWTQSRVLGVNAAYRSVLTAAQYQPGYSFRSLPEHTWAASVTYTNRLASAALNLNGIGFTYRSASLAAGEFDSFYTRLNVDKPIMNVPDSYRALVRAYIMADLNTVYHLTTKADGVFQVQNLMDHYQNDWTDIAPVIGRQIKVGLRIHS